MENASGFIEGAIVTDLENGWRHKKKMLVDKTDPTRAERSEHEVRAASTTGFAENRRTVRRRGEGIRRIKCQY